MWPCPLSKKHFYQQQQPETITENHNWSKYWEQLCDTKSQLIYLQHNSCTQGSENIMEKVVEILLKPKSIVGLWQGNCVHGIPTTWLHQQNLSNSNTSWHPNVDGGISQGPNPRKRKSYTELTTDKEKEWVFLRDEPLVDYPIMNAHNSDPGSAVEETCAWRQH